MSRSERALEFYSKGFNCSQSVIASFADILKLDKEIALRMSSGFGGGMGRMQETCGAATGAFMVIGYLRGRYNDEDECANDETNKLIQEFSKRFVQNHGSVMCKSLINIDLNTENGRIEAEKTDVFNKKCTVFIKTAVELLEELIVG